MKTKEAALRSILAIIAATFLLSGCALVGLEAAVVEGEMAALDSVGSEAAAARLATMEGAAAPGSLSEAIARLTANGEQTAVLTVNDTGVISAGNRVLANVTEDGGLYVRGATQRVGYLQNGQLYEISNSGSRVIGELHGFVPSRGVILDESGAIRILKPNVFVDVLQIENGRYLVRLASGETEWIDPGFVVLLLASANQANQCPAGSGVLVTTSGRPTVFDDCTERSDVFVLNTPDGEVFVDAADTKSIYQGAIEGYERQRAVRLTGGETIYGTVQQFDQTIRITDDSGNAMIADNSRLADSSLESRQDTVPSEPVDQGNPSYQENSSPPANLQDQGRDGGNTSG